MVNTQEQECKCNSSFKFDNFNYYLYCMNWRLATRTLLDMKTHFDLDNFNGRPKWNYFSKEEVVCTKISKCCNILIYDYTVYWHVSQSTWICTAPVCCVQEHAEDKTHIKNNSYCTWSSNAP
jgi:hypothetical protein